jgi:integrase
MEARGRAESTKLGQVRQLERFLNRTGLSEDQLLAAAKDPRRIAKLADGYVDSEKKAGRRPTYALAVWYSVKNFLKSAGVVVPHNPPLDPEEMEPVDFESRRVPTQAELRQLIDGLSLQYRGIALVLATSGVRIGAIAKGVGSDGLRLENLPDLDPSTGKFAAKPPLIVVPARLSKNKKPYVTAMTSESAGVVETCLSQRLRAGEKLGPKSPLFTPDPRGRVRELRTKEGDRTFNRNALSGSLSKRFSKMSPPGVRWTGHTLRAWCSSRLESAESQGVISRTRREFFMGHSLGVDGKYNLDRPLSEEKREEIRESYRKVEPFLSTVPSDSHVGRDVGMLKALLELLGVPEGKISEGELKDATPEQLKELAQKYRGQTADARQRVVTNGEIPKLLGEGWTFVATLSPEQVVLAPPGG